MGIEGWKLEVDRLADDRQNQIEMQHAHQAHSSPLLGVVGQVSPLGQVARVTQNPHSTCFMIHADS